MTSHLTQHADPSASKMAAGLKFAALAAVLALIVVMADTGPGMLSSGVVGDAQAVVTDEQMPVSQSEYYPAHFAAPTATTELPPQF